MNTLAHDVAPLLHYAVTHCMLFRFSTHPQYRIVICKNCTCTSTSKVAIGPEHMIPKTYPLALSPICTLSCTLCELKITVHFWARNVRSGSPPNALHSSSNIMNVNKPGSDGRPRSSLLRAPGWLRGFLRGVLRWFGLPTASFRPSFTWGGSSGRAGPIY